MAYVNLSRNLVQKSKLRQLNSNTITAFAIANTNGWNTVTEYWRDYTRKPTQPTAVCPPCCSLATHLRRQSTRSRQATATTITLAVCSSACRVQAMCFDISLSPWSWSGLLLQRIYESIRPPSKTKTTLGVYCSFSLIVPATRHSTLGDRAFPVIGARLWNSLPDDITTATSLLTFRHKLKNIFISSIIWQCRLVTTVLSFLFKFFNIFFGFYFLALVF